MVQWPGQAAYGLTLHKVQALSMKERVQGCLEGVFAQGSVYVLISRVTDPRNLELIGLPPRDLLDRVAAEWLRLGLDVNKCMANACKVTGEWKYTPAKNGRHASSAIDVYSRLERRRKNEKLIPVKLRGLHETLNPQPDMSKVLSDLLEWIDRENDCVRSGAPAPEFCTLAGEEIFPESEWWLTDVQKRNATSDAACGEAVIEEGPPSGDEDLNANPEHAASDEDDEASVNDDDSSESEFDIHDERALPDLGSRVDLESIALRGSAAQSRDAQSAPLSLWRSGDKSNEQDATCEADSTGQPSTSLRALIDSRGGLTRFLAELSEFALGPQVGDLYAAGLEEWLAILFCHAC